VTQRHLLPDDESTVVGACAPAEAVREQGGGRKVPRSIANVRVESSVANKIDPFGQTWRKSRPMGNRRLPIGGHQPRSQKAGHHPKGVARPISDRNLTFAYELETWRLAGCRHDQQQALLRWRDLERIHVPFDCLQRSLGHGRICCVRRRRRRRRRIWRGASVARPPFYGKGGTSIAPFRAAMITFFTSSFST